MLIQVAARVRTQINSRQGWCNIRNDGNKECSLPLSPWSHRAVRCTLKHHLLDHLVSPALFAQKQTQGEVCVCIMVKHCVYLSNWALSVSAGLGTERVADVLNFIWFYSVLLQELQKILGERRSMRRLITARFFLETAFNQHILIRLHPQSHIG